MSVFRAVFGGGSDDNRTPPRVLPEDLVPVPYEVMVPWLPGKLLEILRCRAGRPLVLDNVGDMVNWRFDPGSAIPYGHIVADFAIDWSGINTKNVFKERRAEILGGAVKMPFDGILRFTSRDEKDNCFCSLQPLVEETQTFEAQHKYRGVSREDYEARLKSWVDPHNFFFPTCEAMWLILDRENRQRPRDQQADPNELLNQAWKTVKTSVTSRNC